jgi:hypothetical protein
VASSFLGAEKQTSTAVRNKVMLRTVAVSITCNITNQNYHKVIILIRMEIKAEV